MATKMQTASTIKWTNHIQIAIARFFPWINDIWKDENGVFHCSGIYPDIMKSFARAANFTYEFYTETDLGSGFRMPNGTWTGVGGILQRKEMDMFYPWAEPRDAGIESSWPLFITETKMLASMGPPEGASFINFLFTFDVEIWYILFSSLAVTILVCALSDVFLKSKSFQRKPVFKEIDYYFWMFLSALFCEGSFKVPVSRRSQSLLCLWLIAILTLMTGFSGQFKAQLMKQKEEDKIQTTDDLADRPQLIPIMSKETTVQFCFERNPVEGYRRVWKIAQEYGDKSLLHLDLLKEMSTYQRVKDGSSVIIFEIVSMRSFYNSICRNLTGHRKMYFSEPNLDFVMLTFSIRPDIPKEFLQNFNIWILRMTESYLIKKALADAIWTKDNCEDPFPEQALALKNLLPIFYLLFILNIFSTLAFFGEMYVHRRAKKTAELQPQIILSSPKAE